MAYVKVTVSIDPVLVKQARAIAGTKGLSAWVARAVTQQLIREQGQLWQSDLATAPDLRDEVDAWDAEVAALHNVGGQRGAA